MLRKTIHATLIVILMMGAASAQGDQPGFFRGDGENSLRDRNLEKKSDRAIDRERPLGRNSADANRSRKETAIS
jgi:hypothetical protein